MGLPPAEETARAVSISARGNVRAVSKAAENVLKCGKRAVISLNAVRATEQFSAVSAENFPARG